MNSSKLLNANSDGCPSLQIGLGRVVLVSVSKLARRCFGNRRTSDGSRRLYRARSPSLYQKRPREELRSLENRAHFKHQCRLRAVACRSLQQTYLRSPQVLSFLSERSSVLCLREAPCRRTPTQLRVP